MNFSEVMVLQDVSFYWSVTNFFLISAVYVSNICNFKKKPTSRVAIMFINIIHYKCPLTLKRHPFRYTQLAEDKFQVFFQFLHTCQNLNLVYSFSNLFSVMIYVFLFHSLCIILQYFVFLLYNPWKTIEQNSKIISCNKIVVLLWNCLPWNNKTVPQIEASETNFLDVETDNRW